MLIKVYLRREPTTDKHTLEAEEFGPQRRCDVVAYKDEAATIRRARWAWYAIAPAKASKIVMLNCLPYRAVWLSDLELVRAPAPKKPRRAPSPILKVKP